MGLHKEIQMSISSKYKLMIES